jgi:hypothetical protein
MAHGTIFTWDEAASAMIAKWPKLAAQRFDNGADYLLAPVEHRSDQNHKHEFAWIREAWLNLPEALADEYASPEHLRKRALIMAGFYVETILDVGSHAAALRVAQFARGEDEYAVAVVRGGVVVVRKAKSQSKRTMDKAEFQASKTAILDIIAGMIGVSPETLNKQDAKA